LSVSLISEAVIPSSVGWMEWDVTNHVKDALYNNLTSLNLLFKIDGIPDEENRIVTFWSRDYTTDINLRPQLIIDGEIKQALKDTYIENQYPTSNNGISTTIILRIYHHTTGDFINYGILSFDLNGISSTINSIFKLYVQNYSFSAGRKIEVYKLNRPDWVEVEATWNNYKTVTLWTTPGGDYTDISNISEISTSVIKYPNSIPIIFPMKIGGLYF